MKESSAMKLSKTFCVSLVCLLLLSWVSPVQAQWNARITNEQPIITVRLHAVSGSTLTATMTRTSGDLVPFLALVQNSSILQRSLTQVKSRTELTFQFTADGDYDLIATRLDAEEGTTTGDFILTIEGAEATNPTIQTSPNATLPKYNTPAIVFELGQTLEGIINDEVPATRYLLYAPIDSLITVHLEQRDGDLQPSLVILSLDDQFIQRGSLEATESTAVFQANQANWYVITATRFDVESGTTHGSYRITATAGLTGLH
jgi:hypothetical protein